MKDSLHAVNNMQKEELFFNCNPAICGRASPAEQRQRKWTQKLLREAAISDK